MADPFELRLFFSNRLRALNPCEDNTEEVVAFALKHRDLDEDLWSCVLEQLERDDNNINVRANICYFLEDLVELSKRERHGAYVRMVERDFLRMMDAVIPLDGLGVVNVNCVRYVLHVLHYDLGVFCTTQNRAEHDRKLGQTWDTKTFDELEAYLERRALEARPDLIEPETDDESEPDMSWVDMPVEVVAEMEVDDKSHADTVATSLEMKDNDIVMADPHDLPSPPGTRSPSDTTTPLHTPRPPTPLSPSPSPSASLRQQPSTTSPASTKHNGHPQTDVTSPTTPKVFSPVKSSTTTTNDTTAAAAAAAVLPPTTTTAPQHTPSAFTPVQKEDAIIFAQAYFELATERMEQDRERQRRKEDSSGFVAVVAGTVDDEVAQILAGAPTKGDVWLEDLVAERVVWGAMGE